MKRLTKPNSKYTDFKNYRLQQYEDTGLSPEEVKELVEQFKAINNPIAEQEGHCVVLPAVDNQTVYCIMPQLKENIIHEVFITTVEISYTLKDGIRFLGIMDDIDDWECDLSDFGKYVFITREAAETALKTIESA